MSDTQPVQIDHIYPQDKFRYDPESDDDSPLDDVDEEVRAACDEYRHSLSNLQLIPENQEKSDRNPANWLARDKEYGQSCERVDRHYLPLNNPDD